MTSQVVKEEVPRVDSEEAKKIRAEAEQLRQQLKLAEEALKKKEFECDTIKMELSSTQVSLKWTKLSPLVPRWDHILKSDKTYLLSFCYAIRLCLSLSLKMRCRGMPHNFALGAGSTRRDKGGACPEDKL